MVISGADKSDKLTQVIPHGEATIRGKTIVAADASFCKILNTPEDALLGMDLSVFYRTKGGFDQFLEEIRRATAGQTKAVLVTSWCRRGGEVAQIVAQITPARMGEVEEWRIEAFDTTVVHRTTRLKQRHQKILSAILDHSPLGFGLMFLAPSGDRVMGWYNPAMGKIFGYDSEGLLGKSTRIFYEDAETFKEAGKTIRSQIEKYGMGDFIRQMVRRDGSHIDVRVLAIPVHIDNEISLLTIVEDITEQKQAQIEKEKLERQIHELHKMEAIGQLAGGIAHDFNNMLGGIMGSAEILEFHLADNPEARKYHQIILDSSRRAADLIQKLLTFSRSNPQDQLPVNLHQILKETAVLLENTIDRRIGFETHLTAEVDRIIGDPSLLQNIFLNLAINSGHAMPHGGTIVIETRNIDVDDVYCNSVPFDLEPGEYIQVEVIDTGNGIAPENIGKIFEPFYTTKEKGRGTGLGLSMVYGAVQQHKGAITVYSELGTGTTFHVLLPVTEESDTQKPNLSAIKMGHGRILVVDDEEVMRTIAKNLLGNMGYDVILAQNGQEALDIYKAASDSIDLILLDMIMPVMNGMDCFTALKQYDPQVRVILSSGLARDEDIRSMVDAGLKGIIRKPFFSSDLSQIVHEVLSS